MQILMKLLLHHILYIHKYVSHLYTPIVSCFRIMGVQTWSWEQLSCRIYLQLALNVSSMPSNTLISYSDVFN